MTDEDTLSSRIARRLTTIAFICCLYGISVWLGRAGEPDQAYWLAGLGVAAASMLGCRAHLAGVDLPARARGVVGAGRRGVEAARASIAGIACGVDRQQARSVALTALVVTSAVIGAAGGLALVGTQPVDYSDSGLASAQSVKLDQSAINNSVDVNNAFIFDTISETNTVLVRGGSGSEKVLAMNASGLNEVRWSYQVNSGFIMDALYHESSGYVHIASSDGLVIIDPETQTQVAKLTVGSNLREIEQDSEGRVYISDLNGNVTQYVNGSNGWEENWTVNTGSERIKSFTTVAGHVFAGTASSNTDYIYKLSQSDGSIVNSVQQRADWLTDLNGNIYVADASGGQIHSYDANLSLRWSDSATRPVAIGADNHNDRIYVGDDTGSAVYGYDESGTRVATESTGGEVNSILVDEYGLGVGNASVYASYGGSPGTVVQFDTGLPSKEVPGSTGSSDLNGTVSTQTNDGVANATVQLTISKQPSIPQADAQLDDLSNPIPIAFKQQVKNGFDLLGDGGFLDDKDGEYAAIYSTADLGLTYKAEADLSEPKITNVEPGEEQAIILADTTADCGVFGFNTNEYNQQIRGCVQPEGNVTIEKLSGTGDVVATDSVPVKEAGNQRDFGGPTNVHYATFTFTEGVYRISPEGDDGISYLVKAGDPTPDFNRYSQTVENQYTTQAQNMRDAISQDLLEVKTVTTNETGYWEASLPSNAKLVTVSARKAPGVNVDPANLSRQNMTEAYNAENSPNASVYLPSRTKRVSPPAENVEITLTEVPFPSFANIDKLQTRLQELRNKLNNLTMDDLPQHLLQRLETESRDDLATAWTSLRGTLINFEPAREAYLEISDRDSVPTAGELSKSELQAAIQNANVAITRTSSTGQLTETATETTQDTVSKTWELTGIPLEEANVSVLADYSNGTTRVVDDQFIATDSSITGTETISVEELPLGEDDPEQVSFRLRVAGNNELAETTSSVLNPTFAGEVPSIDAVEVTSLQPGPSDRVTVEIHPDEQSTFERVTQMTVRGPDGSTIETSNISDGTTASFTTDGAGTHSIRFTVESASGGTFTDVVQIEAADTDESLRPSIYAHSGPLGTYALVGDGFESGDVETTSTGSLEIVGVLGADQEPPNTVDVFLEGVDVGTESTTTIRIVRGESRQSVRANVPMVIHTPMLNSPDDDRSYKTLVRASGNPITWSGDTRYGVVEQDDDGASIKAYTDDSGVLTLSLDNTPTWVERNSFWLDTNYPWVPLTVGASPLLGSFVVVSLRRRSN